MKAREALRRVVRGGVENVHPERVLYLLYYLKQLDTKKLARFVRHARAETGKGVVEQAAGVVTYVLRYNVSILECYQFRFFSSSDEVRRAWAGTGTMYEFQRRANPPDQRGVLADKRRFYEAYRQFFRHEMQTREALLADPALGERLLARHERLVFKPAKGNCGIGIHFAESKDLQPAGLAAFMEEHGFDLVEEDVVQHDALKALSPSGVNTVRIFTVLDKAGRARILGCRLRITVGSRVDNMAAGNIAAPLDEATGVVTGPGVYSDVTRSPETHHPLTGTPIVGFQVPYWGEALELARAAAELHPQNRSIGWDIVVTPEGPGLIEGNHDWCKLVWQLPVGSGLKPLLEEVGI